ncbi:hypothetical protein HYALB_00009058 [Hymenoscyphus albidus]|uniref:Peptidase S8/S53 domain-containing protein n=1 Tax=Hymenoscyphus albidus TaxID=595503 RepID=A0A9N9LIT3_9HELO|nr:hypothetical protein HYALB_00009058 [Hymenoscyphus albidus]
MKLASCKNTLMSIMWLNSILLKEFPNVAEKHHQTPEAIRHNYQLNQDHSLPNHPSHSTCTAGKALGKTYGVAKNAQLVIVQMARISLGEIIAAFGLIEDELLIATERRGRSVINMSLGGPTNGKDNRGEELRDLVATMINLDVPVIVAAGNYAPGLRVVDHIPGVWAAPDFPILAIGSTNKNGKLTKWSQGGEQVFLHAVGEEISCLDMTGGIKVSRGTSYTAPQVAGEVASFLSYDPVPFNTDEHQVVKTLWDYLHSNAGSW